jgi:hypothetical protein
MITTSIELELPEGKSWYLEKYLSIFFASKTIRIAESWDELTEKQFLKVCEILVINKNRSMELLLLLTKEITTLKSWQYMFLNIEDIYLNLLPRAEFLLKTPEFTESKIEFIRHRGQKLYAPKKVLSNWNVEQFATAETLIQRFLSEKKGVYLNQLAFTIFRPKNESFIELDEKKYSRQFMKPKYQAAALFIYMGMRQMLPQMYPNIYDKAETKGKQNGEVDWHSVIVMATNNDITKRHAIGQTNLHDWLKFHDENAKRNESVPA